LARDAGLGGEAAPPTDGGGLFDDDSYLTRPIPVLLINVNGQTIPYNKDKIPGTLKVVEDREGAEAVMGTTLVGIDGRPTTFEGRLGIEVRGQSSSGYPQKPYSLELRDDMGEGLPTPLLGLPREADFVLHSCYADKSCMRNALTYAVAREMAVPQGRWAPRTRYVEVTLDGKYQGLYLLVERIKRDKNRVALPAPAPSAAMGDVTGGYILSLENTMKPAERAFLDPLTGKAQWIYRSPNFREITAEQKTYIRSAISSFLKALMARPTWAEAKKLADAESWIDFFLMQELTNNNDGYWKSWYFGKHPDAASGRIFMGPVWDYDIAYGNVNYNKRYCTTNLMGTSSPAPFRAIFADPAFANEVRCRYQTLRASGGPLDHARLDARLDAFVAHVTRAKARDVALWKNIGRYVWPNNFVGATWADEVTYLRYWIHRRLAWLDATLPGTCPAAPQPPAVPQVTPPTPIRETAARTGICCGGAAAYVPIEGPVDMTLAAFACPL
jgi:hypothetical protein